MNMISNISVVLPAYIFIYEILEKFFLKLPFVLLESDNFSRQAASAMFFREYLKIETRVQIEDPLLETITYSGIEISSYESLLLLAHEAFHIVDEYQFVSLRSFGAKPLFETFVERTKGVKLAGDDARRCREAFVDALASMYLGPAYGVALRNHFERIYPISGKRHAEMTSRLLLTLLIWDEQRYESPAMDRKTLNESIARFKRLMTEKQRQDAERDLANLQALLRQGMIQFIKEFFDFNHVKIYNQFLSFWKNEEIKSEVDRMDYSKILFCLKNSIPVAVRPVILLNILVDNKKDLTKLGSRLIVSSIKKWYVRRYYQKTLENRVSASTAS